MNTPNDASDDTINALYESEMKQVEYVAKVLDRVEAIMHKPPIDLTKRRYDIDVEIIGSAPADQRYRAIDLSTFDGSPEGVGSFQGYGATAQEARIALLEMFADHDGRPRPSLVKQSLASKVIFSSPFEPPEYKDEPGSHEDWEGDDRE